MLWIKAFFQDLVDLHRTEPISDVSRRVGALRHLQDVGSRAQWCFSSYHFLWQAGLSVLLPKVGHILWRQNFEEKFSRSRDTSCPTCVGGCNTVEMNGKAPSNIQNLFKDVSLQMKCIVKTLGWQDNQKKSIVEHKVITRIQADSLIAIEMSK